jgi:hypothetical protein
MKSYFRNSITELLSFIKVKNIFVNFNETLNVVLLSILTSAASVISYELFRKYKNKFLQLRKVKSNLFKLHRQMIVLWNNFTKNLITTTKNTNSHDLAITINSIDIMMLHHFYEKNKKIYEMNNFNNFCQLKYKIQLQSKSHLLIKNSGMMIGAFHKLANVILMR